VHRGYFIVLAIRTTSRQMGADGRLIAITVRVSLKEWAFESEISSTATPVALFPLIGIVAAPPGSRRVPSRMPALAVWELRSARRQPTMCHLQSRHLGCRPCSKFPLLLACQRFI
jgi:hypothetical protein